MTYCRWPDHAVVVGPQGELKPCCMITHIDMIDITRNPDIPVAPDDVHIDKLDSLAEFPYTDFSIALRNSISTKGYENTKLCHNCVKQKKMNGRCHADDGVFKWLNKDWQTYSPGEISYLEITTSNICNQTCITCNSYFSSKWKTIEHLFDNRQGWSIAKGQNHVLSDNGFKKILDILPQIKLLHIKGGEPFSDLRNAQILERLAEVNPNCRLWITSNCSIISKRFMNVLKKFNPENIHMIASLDGIYKKYEWIRGTNFEQTLETCKKLYYDIGILPKVLPTISYFNILDIHEIQDFYTNCDYLWIDPNGYSHMNRLHEPVEMHHLKTRTQEELDTLNLDLVSEFNPALLEALQRKIEIMNGVRGFRWQDC